ncbi:hypothetical protein PYW07_010693 [Mythimna separata]|uniref:Uncharacterized protein n=1 Tax=Mythimna separata TaxID=271217 RepID=A0AAD8DKM5_MYTSE|nr:hypothetical protein PYW07_010693 [Mythimna separata]
MASFPPVTLVGDNLGQRHRHLNSLVREATQSGASFQEVEALPEESAVDRLFKIDLAIELKHVDYIIRNLKDDDMLYVSRALKATWLIDHRDIINPKYLEDVLFPEMIKPAVTKMKHWLYINLRDPAMCEEFYQHYKENTFEFSIKFLDHCSHEFILEEAPKILTKLSTHSLKVLCEKCPGVAKIYFDSLAKDEVVKKRYLENEHNYNLKQKQSYYNSVKCVLKLDADVFLDITEKYFNINRFSRLSPLATDYILRYHKTRFINKLELYVAYFLHIPTVAARLSVEECQEVVLKLARASYLQHWFQYKVVEPLIKRLSPDKRAAFKRRVFVDKDVGVCEDKWPYEIPAPPVRSDTGPHIFDDQDFGGSSLMYAAQARSAGGAMAFGAVPMCATAPQALKCMNMQMNMIRVKTDLDRLFDEFRFIGFERALHELSQRLVATASSDRRRDIFIVLVSKTGGRPDAVSALLRLAARHSNEPPHIRAAVLRSLVKRAKVWRLPTDVWQHLLDFGHGLGLDGTNAEAACHEGLHAVVIRQLLAGECEPAICEAFMKNFSTLVEYSLKVDERERVASGLQNMLAMNVTHDEPEIAMTRLWKLLDVFKIYRVRIEPSSPAVKAVIALASRDADVARPLLVRLYNERIARRELLRYNMEFRQDEAALLNALRHDPSALELKRVLDMMAVWKKNYDSFPSRPNVFGRSAVPRTGFSIGSSAPPSNTLTFGRAAPPQTDSTFDGSTAPVAVPTADVCSSTSQSTEVSRSIAPPIGFHFESSAGPTTGFCFGNSTSSPAIVGSSAAPPTGYRHDSAAVPTSFHFGSSTAQSADVDSSTTPPTEVKSSTTTPTGINFSSVAHSKDANNSCTSTDTLTGASSSVCPPTSFRFGSSAAEPTDIDNSSAPGPIGFNIGSSTSPSTDVYSLPTLPRLDSNSANQPMGFSSPASQSKHFGLPATQPMHPSNAVPHVGFARPTPEQTHFGMPNPQPMRYGGNASQLIGFGRRWRRRFGTRQANFDRFIAKLIIYFDQKQDLTPALCTALTDKFTQGQNFKLARPLASLYGSNFEQELRDFDAAGQKSKKIAAALRACAVRARPAVNLAEWGWRKAGVKAVATRAMRCREIERAAFIRALATEKRTVRVALALSMRSASGLLVETFASAAKMRPAVALRTALTYFRRHGASSDLRVWQIVKPLISSNNLETNVRLRQLLGKTDWIPSSIKPDYCITLYIALFKISSHNAQMLLRELSKVLPECGQSIETILLQMLDDDADNDITAIPYPTIFTRYLLLSENEEDVERRFMKIGNRFLERIDTLRRERDYYFQIKIREILESLKYNAAFLDAKFPSCLSVIERIFTWLQYFMPKEKYFKNYTQVRLTMVYYRAVRQSMKEMPEVFADPKRRKSEGVEAVGFVFGRYIVQEVVELVNTYFDSIIDIYTDSLLNYLSGFMYGTSRNIFIGFLLKGILTEAVGIQRRIAVYVLRDHQISIEDSARKEIEELIMSDRALQFFAHAELFTRFPVVPYRKMLLR